MAAMMQVLKNKTQSYSTGQARQGNVPTKGSNQAPSMAVYRPMKPAGKVTPFSKTM